jgi:hypothetical protein
MIPLLVKSEKKSTIPREALAGFAKVRNNSRSSGNPINDRRFFKTLYVPDVPAIQSA